MQKPERLLRYAAGWTFAFLAAVAAPAVAQDGAPDQQEPAVIEFQNREIVTLRATLGPSTPKVRAQAAMERLSNSKGSDFRQPVKIVTYADARGIFLGDRMVFGLVPGDLDPTGDQTLDQLAATASQNLREAADSWSDQRRPEVVLAGVVHVLIAIAVAIAALIALNFVRRRLLRALPSRAERAMEKRQLTLFGQDLRGAAVRVLRGLIDAAAVVAMLMLLYAWLAYSLKQFPLTEPWGEGLAGFLGDTLGMVGLGLLRGIPDMIVVVIVLVVTRFFVQVATNIFNAVEKGHVKVRGVHPDTADATRRMVTSVIWVFGIAIAYPFIPGSSSEAFKGISVLVGVMLSLGSSGVINQAMSGMVVVFSRALKIGEYVCIDQYEGVVTEVGALSTKLRTLRNEEVNIPNATLVSSTTKNYSRLHDERGVIVYSTVGIGYDAPWRTVHRILTEAALRTPGLRREPAPFVRQSALSSFCVDYTINAYLEEPARRIEVLSNLNANIQDVFNDAEIQIMTPAFESQPEQPILGPKTQNSEARRTE